jgi:hypothetical protein
MKAYEAVEEKKRKRVVQDPPEAVLVVLPRSTV